MTRKIGDPHRAPAMPASELQAADLKIVEVITGRCQPPGAVVSGHGEVRDIGDVRDSNTDRLL